ncbi:hypothetical protein FRC03_002888 [Tulasnella sp. 419]|nr:hypothetical protein FRC02_010460 [Tulasnella sp. 418]KAG8963531.1 hypothetical protein FRC03_002888 [Tulasnella sp. 419]
MTTIPSRLARTAQRSLNLEMAKKRSLELYRDWYRHAPEIVTIHGLTIPPSLVRARIRAEFERHRYVDDPAVIDVLVQKGRQDFQEVMNAWQQESHILGVLLIDKSKEPKSFLQHFYEGRDEEQVRIASPQTSYP